MMIKLNDEYHSVGGSICGIGGERGSSCFMLGAIKMSWKLYMLIMLRLGI